MTHALLAGSPALDAGGAFGLATDQRGVSRPQRPAIDIGAFESRLAAPGDVIRISGAPVQRVVNNLPERDRCRSIIYSVKMMMTTKFGSATNRSCFEVK